MLFNQQQLLKLYTNLKNYLQTISFKNLILVLSLASITYLLLSVENNIKIPDALPKSSEDNEFIKNSYKLKYFR